MTFRNEHPVLATLIGTFLLCVTVVACIFGISYFSVENAKIQADKELKQTEITEREETERVEEKAQFWQKLVPWGNDEEEGSKE